MLLRHSIDGATYQFDELKKLLAKATVARSPRRLGAGGLQVCRLEPQKFFVRRTLERRVEGLALLNRWRRVVCFNGARFPGSTLTPEAGAC